MNESQFKLVKTFLDGFKVPAMKLAKAWKIDSKLMRRAAVARNYEHFCDMPDEDLDLLGEQLFGDLWKSMKKAS